ncbi:MAG: glycoside hydrolase family 97 protein, partial [Carboxylicivirga sp.]|nr:glycoside hydrolase family 97 protein [Carboxylicivirga sp.]
YNITYKQNRIVDWSSVVLKLDDIELGRNCTLKKIGEEKLNQTYSTFGNRSKVELDYKLITYRVRDREVKNTPMFLDIRIYNNGVATRLRTNLKKERWLFGDQTRWNIKGNPTVFYAHKQRTYEGEYTQKAFKQLLSDSISLGKAGTGLEMRPATTLHWKDKEVYMLISEANLVDYSGMSFLIDENGFETTFPYDKDGWPVKGELKTPWRVSLITDDLTKLATNDLFTALCAPPSDELEGASWIRPGRSSWQWWAVGAPKFEDQKYWYDKTKELGFEYYLIDDGWRFWKTEHKDKWDLLKDCIEYGRSIGVESTIWVHSKYLNTKEKQTKFLQKVKKVGAVGIKIDFFPPESVESVRWYERILKETARLQLMVDFHGCNKPTGLQRTYPHEMTREAIRGQEWHISRFNRVLSPNHDVILPFTRGAIGFSDYTPMVFNPKELFGNTWTKELAKPIMFLSPLTHYADYPMYYIGHPAEDLIKVIPTTWDESIVLPCSELGEVVVMARRKGSEWFIAAINNDQAREISIALSFLDHVTYDAILFTDHADMNNLLNRQAKQITNRDSLTVRLNPLGGFVGWLKSKN